MTVQEIFQLLDTPSIGDVKTEVIVEVCGRTYELIPEKWAELNEMVMAGVADFVVEKVIATGAYHYYITVKSVPVRKEAAV